LKEFKGCNIELAIIGTEEDGRPYFSNIYRIVADLERLFNNKEKILHEGKVIEIYGDKRSTVVQLTRDDNQDPYVVHGFELYDKYKQLIQHLDVERLRLGELVLLELKKSNRDCYIYSELLPEELTDIPDGFKYDPDEQKLFFPPCLNPLILKTSSLSFMNRENIIRTSWERGLLVNVKSLKERLCEIQVGQELAGKITKIYYREGSSTVVHKVDIILTDGTPAFAYRNNNTPSRLNKGDEFKLEVKKIMLDLGILRLAFMED